MQLVLWKPPGNIIIDAVKGLLDSSQDSTSAGTTSTDEDMAVDKPSAKEQSMTTAPILCTVPLEADDMMTPEYASGVSI